jgi:hypothetical protein
VRGGFWFFSPPAILLVDNPTVMHASLMLDPDSRPRVHMHWTLAEVLALRPAQHRMLNGLLQLHVREHGHLSLLCPGIVPAYLQLALAPWWDEGVAEIVNY